MIDLLCIGEALAVGRVAPTGLVECLPIGVGGAELNVALAFRHAGHSVRFATRLGEDPFGALVERTLRDAGVEMLLEIDALAPTGFYLRTERVVDRRAFYYRSGSAGSQLPDIRALHREIRDARWLHVTGVTAALRPENPSALRQLMDFAHASGCKVSFDVNYRPKLWAVQIAAPALREIALRADTVFVGADEAKELWGARNSDDAHHLLPVAELVYKDGDRQVVDVILRGKAYPMDVPEVTIVDSVGAGDAFVGGYLHATLTGGEDIRHRVDVGHAFACVVMESASDVLSRDAVTRALEQVRQSRP
jgi:2-dehydro-3-deoxygluconokinase